MAEPFKNLIDAAAVQAIAHHLQRAWPAFDAPGFGALALQGLDALELKARVLQVARALVAHQATPAAFRRCTKAGGNRPITDETTGGLATSNAAHWASKSSGRASPAAGVVAGPQASSSAQTACSCTASRCGNGSGTHRLIWNGPAVAARSAWAQSTMAAGAISSAPQAPKPPA